MSAPNSMYIVPVICIIDAQNLVKVEVFRTLFFLCSRPYKMCLPKIQAHSKCQNNPCHFLSIDIIFISSVTFCPSEAAQ